MVSLTSKDSDYGDEKFMNQVESLFVELIDSNDRNYKEALRDACIRIVKINNAIEKLKHEWKQQQNKLLEDQP